LLITDNLTKVELGGKYPSHNAGSHNSSFSHNQQIVFK